MPFRLSQCSAVYPETTESPLSRTNLAELPLPNAKSWLFEDDFPSLALKQAKLSRGLTKNLAQTTGKSFPRRSNSSQSQNRHRGDTFYKYQSTGYSNPSNLRQITKGLVQKTDFFVPLPRTDVSQTLRVNSVLENPNIGPTDSLNCFRLQDKFPQNSFSSLHHLPKHRVRRHSLYRRKLTSYCKKGPYKKPLLPGTVFTPACFSYPKREDLCVR